MDDAAWAALTLSLTVLGGIWTWFALRNRGLAAGLRALAFTLLPLAAYLTKTLQMFTGIVTEIGDWASALVFSPTVWAGVMVAGLSVVLFVVSGWMRTRSLGAGKPADTPKAVGPARGSAGKVPQDGAVDPEMAEIEALLRKRGIS